MAIPDFLRGMAIVAKCSLLIARNLAFWVMVIPSLKTEDGHQSGRHTLFDPVNCCTISRTGIRWQLRSTKRHGDSLLAFVRRGMECSANSSLKKCRLGYWQAVGC